MDFLANATKHQNKDFAGGDPSQAYDSIMKLFALRECLYSSALRLTDKKPRTPIVRIADETIVKPGHDYRFNTESTIGREKATNPRCAVTGPNKKTRDE